MGMMHMSHFISFQSGYQDVVSKPVPMLGISLRPSLSLNQTTTAPPTVPILAFLMTLCVGTLSSTLRLRLVPSTFS